MWFPDAQASFDALKQALSSAQVLCTFNLSQQAILRTDARNLVVTEILTQQVNEGLQHQIAYESHTLTSAERNYPVHVLKLLVHALLVFKHYLLWQRRATARGVLFGLQPADGKPGDHVAQDEKASEQDVC